MKPYRKGYKGVYNRYMKRMIDFPAAFLLFTLLAPLFIVISVMIFFNSGLPILYIAERGGYHGKPFHIYKFRTMIKDADKLGGGTSALNDSRITKVGHILRNTKLDEIPQLINIIKGEMSFVGPRPELIKYTSKYTKEEQIIFEVRPGITDYSSLEFLHLDTIVGEKNAEGAYENFVLPRKNKLRISYANKVSLRTDCFLVWVTVIRVIQKAWKYIFIRK